MKSTILLIYTGGTIGMAKDYDTQTLKPFDFQNLLKNIPELSLLDCEFGFKSFKTPIDSSNINPSHWIKISEIIKENYEYYDGFVVLHGTDTMAYSASALSFMLDGLQKPVIFTGSQLPVGDLRTDAKENLITSIHFASLHEKGIPKIKEVCVYFEYKLLRGNRTTKISADNFAAFESPNFPYLGESGIRLDLKPEFFWQENSTKKFSINKNLNADFCLLKIFPGMNPLLVKNMLETNGLKAIIIEAFGSGNIFSEEWMRDLLEKKSKEGIFIIVTTQCAGGTVELGRYETGKIFTEIGAISGWDLTTEASIAKTMFLLGQNLSHEAFKLEYEKNLKGEIS